MPDYWKKKMDELERENEAKSYWGRKMSELEAENKAKKAARSKKKDDDEDDIAPVRTASGSSSYWDRKTSELDSGIKTKTTVNEEPEELKWYQKGLFSDGYDFGDVTKSILGIDNQKQKTIRTFEDVAPTMTIDELQAKRASASGVGEELELTKQYNEKMLAHYSDVFSKTQMDGQNHTVLEEIEILANMDSGDEKDKRKKAVLKKMEEMGMDSTFYAHFAGDGEFNFKTFGKWLGSAALAGIGAFDKSLADTADVLLGNPLKALGWENNPFSKGAEYFGNLYDTHRYNANLYAEKLGGGAWNYGSDFVEGTTGSLPSALLAFGTAGQSLAPTAQSLATQAFSRAGNFLTKAGLTVESMMKNPQFWMSYARTFGSDYKEAKEMGASDLAATVGSILTSFVNAGIEIGPAGDSGIQGLPDAVKKGGKPLLEWVESSIEEGGEEMLQKFVSDVVAKVVYGSDEELLDPIEYAKEGTIGMLSGMAVGGGQIGLHNVQNAVIGHQANKLTQNEQAVLDKEIENRIAEAEEDGKKLTAKEKAKIKEKARSDLEKGYISTDLIEEVIGGETYTEYKDNITNEETLQKEFEELGNVKVTEQTVAQQARYKELSEQIQSIKDSDTRNQLKAKLDEFVAEQVKGSRLAESYNERIRRGQAFEADLTKYDSKQQAVIKKAAESGILNNTNRTHEFVDMVAKISADKGVLFDFTNNEKLKNSGFAVDGKTVNGFVTKDGVTLNIQSSKALNSVVGHEITHVLEGTDLYTELQNAILDYAKPKGEYLSRYNSMKELYKDVYKDLSAEDYDAKINAEITADLVGDYLFTDPDFINNLSTNHRNVFQKIYDEVKYMLKVATAGSKEAKELERVKRAFEKAYRESGETQTEDASETKYSIVEDQATIDFLENQEHIVTYKAMVLIDGKLYPPMASQSRVEEEYTDKKGNKKTKTVRKLKNPSILGKWQQADERPDLAEKSYNPKRGYSSFDLLKSNGKTVPAAYNPYEHTSNIVLNDQFEEAYNRPELVTVEYHIPVSELNSGYKAEYAKDAVGQHSWKSGPVAKDLKDPRQVYLTRWSKPVRIVPDSEVATKYKEILDGTGLSVPFNVVTPSLLSELEKAGVSIDYDGSPMYKSIQRRAAAKETKYSLSDSNGKQLSQEQQEYFKDSVVRDENGNLKVMYHGTSNGGFTTFDTYGSNYGLFGTGSYFTDSKNIGESYTKKGKGKNPQVYEAYLNIKNPMDMDAAADPAEWAQAFPDADFPESGTNEQFYRAVEEFYADQYMPKWEVAEEIQATLESGMGYDGITHIGGGRVNPNGERHRVYIAFQPEQIKNTDNQKPTEDPDIRYSLSDPAIDKNYLDAVNRGDTETAQKMVDDAAKEAGYTSPKLYHGTNKFGFTKFDPEFSDDKISIFATSNNLVAETYSGKTGNYRVSDRPSITPGELDKASPETILKLLQENVDSNIEMVSEEEQNRILNEHRSKISNAARMAEQLHVLTDLSNRGNEIVGKIVTHLKAMETATTYDAFMQADADYDAAMWDLKWEDEKASDLLFEMIYDQVQPAYRGLTNYLGTTLYRGNAEYTKRNGKDTFNQVEAVNELNRTMFRGVYQLYTKPGNQLVIDAEGGYWNQIDGKHINSYGPVKTRDVAKFAKDNGYDSVLIKNLHDSGDYSYMGQSDVHIFFDSKQVKSADPVTYDDKGNVISLSERFNVENDDIRFSLSRNEELMTDAENKNSLQVDLATARQQRQAIYDYMTANADRLKLPEDIEGNTAIKNSSYDISEENTTVCIRSMAADALCDAVAENLGRPLTVQETLLVSQDLMNYTDEPECVYCYVATDRRAYREFLGSYYQQMQSAIESIQSGKSSEEVYQAFLNGRKDTKNMRNRFAMWQRIADGGNMISARDLASEKMMQNAMRDPELAPQIKDARAYAQSASWAKKRNGYQSYNGHILKWSQRRINDLNKHYGLRFYSFSDFSPAFVLENMQQVTDAAVRGLKGLAYTKVLDFAEIFAPTGININISVFGYDQNGVVAQDGMMGADWKGAQDLRNKYENVGITFVATNDSQIDWALNQDWIDVVIPYHLVRTGQAVAKHFGYTNYTAESADTKGENWKKGNKKTIYPSEHNNDKATYLAALADANLEPRFVRWVSHPNYMKLVNETRRSAKDTPPMQAVFNEDAAIASLERMAQRGGYFVPIGGDYENMQEIAGEIADDIRSRHSLSAEGEIPNTYGRYNVYGKDIALETAPMQEDIAPVADTAPASTISETETVAENATIAPVEATNEVANAPEEDLFPDDLAPMPPENDSERLASLNDEDAPPEMEAPYQEDVDPETVEDPFYDRDFEKVGNRKVKAYMYENPEVKPFFQEEALRMRGELSDTVRGERFYSNEGFEMGGNEMAWTGVKRHTSNDIATLLDGWGMTYADIEKGLDAIIEDHGAENIAAAKKIEFMLNDRLLNGYTDFYTSEQIPPNQDYVNLLSEMQITEYSKEAFDSLIARGDEFAPPVAEDDIAPVAAPVANETAAVSDRAYEAIRPQPPKTVIPAPADDDIGPVEYGDKLVRVDSNNGRPGEKQRKWVGTSTESEVVNRQVLPDDLDQDAIHYQPISNKVTLGRANAKLDGMGYETSVSYFNSQFANKRVSLEDVALGERLIQEAIKRGDTKTAGDLIQNVAILGTELGQKVQALSMIQRMTPEGQLKMLQKTVERGKTKGDKAYDDVVITQEMIDKILKAYKPDGSYDQTYLDGVVEDVKKQIADQMKVTVLDKVNAWRYLSMLGNPKTHIRNVVSNVAMRGTVAVKNALARTIESVAPVQNRTKTWKKPTEYIKSYAQHAAMEMKEIISDGGKYSEDASIKQKRDTFKNKLLNGLYEFNSEWLEKEDWWFSKAAFTSALTEHLTANGIRTSEDVRNNPKLVEKARVYATEQSQIATFRQYSWLANKINDIERHNTVADIAVGAIMPFKKTPINIAKTGLNYSPLGFAKTLTYDVSQVKNGNMEASELIDHLSQNITGSALTLVGYMLASSGFLSGAGDDDKEGEYDYQLGQQAYAINIGGKSYSLSWLSPIAMPLFVGANAYEQLVEGKEWNGDVVVETLAQTLDPLSEMSFLSGLDSVLSSYDSGIQKFAGIGESMVQNYATQFVPTLSSQVATVLDDTKRTTKVGSDSDFRFVDQTINKLKYKIPFLRETLEPATDIWGNNIEQTENVVARAVETFLAPYAAKEKTITAVDEEIKSLYRESGEDSVIPGIPYNSVTYKDQKYKMSEKEFTAYKQTYGQTAFGLLEELFRTDTYRNADASERADMVGKVYGYASDLAKQEFLAKKNVEYTNATSDGEPVYKEDAIKGAIEADMPVDEYTFSVKYPEKHAFLDDMGITYETYINADEDSKKAYSWAMENPDKYPMSKAVASDVVEYRRYTSELYDIRADKDKNGKSISGSRKEKVLDYINGLDIDYGAKLILFKSEYNSDDDSNYEIIDYLNSRSDISYEEELAILRELGFTVTEDGTIYWD